jgi:hypothetical protein
VPPHCKCASFSYRLAASLAAIMVTWEYQILFVIVARDASCGAMYDAMKRQLYLYPSIDDFDYSAYFIIQCF